MILLCYRFWGAVEGYSKKRKISFRDSAESWKRLVVAKIEQY